MDTTMTPEILRVLPNWILACIALLWAGKVYIYPFFSKYTDVGKAIMKNRADEIEREILQVKAEMEDWKRRFLQLDLEYKRLSVKYHALVGVVHGFQVYLKEKGVSDFPTMPDFVTESNIE
jgi:hypothetical protein